MAPYTGPYYKYIKHKDEIPDTCFDMFAYHHLTDLSEMEVEEGWIMKDQGGFIWVLSLFCLVSH